MKKIVLIIIVLCVIYSSAYAQDNGTLPIFVIQDREFASIIDGFIVDAKKIECESPKIYNIYITLSDDTYMRIPDAPHDRVHFLFILNKQNESSSDSMIFNYESRYHQAFIQHRDVLFRIYVESHSVSLNYHLLTGLLKVSPTRQSVYFKSPPLDIYDSYSRGRWKGYVDGEQLLSSNYDYYGGKWYCDTMFFDEDDGAEG